MLKLILKKTFKEDNSIKIVFAPFWNGVFCERKEFAPKVSKCFHFRVDFFPERDWTSTLAQFRECHLCDWEVVGLIPS